MENNDLPRAAAPVSPSSREGMGAIPYDGGTSFRVWAPHAEAVAVVGPFNDWSPAAHPLAAESGGYWSAEVPGVRPGDEYKFWLRNGELEVLRNDPYARCLTNSVGNSIVHDPHFDWTGDDFQMVAWNEMVIYEMHVGTFGGGENGQPGSFEDAIAKLDHLKALGVNAILIMPPQEFGGFDSWGYNPAYIFSIERDYGGPLSFQAFIKAAHANGMAVLLDVVYNHLGPGDLDLWQFDGWSENGKGGIYFYNDWRAETPWGETRPDYGREEVRRYLRDNALMWLNDYHVDGLRWDATAYIHNVKGTSDPASDLPEGWGLMRWINDEIKASQPWKISIAEDLRLSEFTTKETSEGGAGFDAQWDDGFAHAVRAAVVPPDDAARDAAALQNAIHLRFNRDAFERVIYTESHDQVANGQARLPEEIAPGDAGGWAAKKRSTLGAALVMTAPGIPMLFQGQEFMEDQWFHSKDFLDWGKREGYGGILHLYQDLIRLRRNLDGKTRGLCGQWVDTYHTDNEAKIIAFHRWDAGGPGDSVVVVANLANQAHDSVTIGFPRPGAWKVRFNSDWDGYDAGFANHLGYDTTAEDGEMDGQPAHGNVGIGPYSVLILSQDE